MAPGLPWGSAPPSGGDPARQADRHGSGDRVARAVGEAAGHSLSEERPPRALLWPQSRRTWHADLARRVPRPHGPRRAEAPDWAGHHSPVFCSLLWGQNLFDSIKSEPFSIPEDDGNDLTHTFFNPDREGWLLKLGEAHTRARGRHTRTHAGTHRTHAHVNMQPRGLSQVTHARAHTHTPFPDPQCSCPPAASLHLSVLGQWGGGGVEDEQEEEMTGQQSYRPFNYRPVSLPGGLLRKPGPERLGYPSEATQPTSG